MDMKFNNDILIILKTFVQGSKLMLTNSQNASDFDNLSEKNIH